MAAVHVLSYRLIDDAGEASNVNIYLPAATSVASAQSFVDTNAITLDAVTGSKIDAASISLALSLPGGLKGSPLADHFNQQGANFGFDAANTPYRSTIRVPAIRDTLVAGGAVNGADAAVLAFISDIVTGLGGVNPTDRAGADLSGFLEAYLSFRKK